LAQQFHGDPGAMAPLFLNYLLIAPGESFFMAANEPHAYVAGEIIECMACSDNVVGEARFF
jgi:mannose-6-phosphate isomerase